MRSYPHTEQFLKYAAANCGMPVTHRAEHESIAPGSTLVLLAPSPPQVTPERKLRTIRIRVDAIRAGKLAVNEDSQDKPFEGTVIKSSHAEIKRGDEVIGLASQTGDTLLVNTSNPTDMQHLEETYSSAEYRKQVVL
jgi:hypothetical protein